MSFSVLAVLENVCHIRASSVALDTLDHLLTKTLAALFDRPNARKRLLVGRVTISQGGVVFNGALPHDGGLSLFEGGRPRFGRSFDDSSFTDLSLKLALSPELPVLLIPVTVPSSVVIRTIVLTLVVVA